MITTKRYLPVAAYRYDIRFGEGGRCRLRADSGMNVVGVRMVALQSMNTDDTVPLHRHKRRKYIRYILNGPEMAHFKWAKIFKKEFVEHHHVCNRSHC